MKHRDTYVLISIGPNRLGKMDERRRKTNKPQKKRKWIKKLFTFQHLMNRIFCVKLSHLMAFFITRGHRSTVQLSLETFRKWHMNVWIVGALSLYFNALRIKVSI